MCLNLELRIEGVPEQKDDQQDSDKSHHEHQVERDTSLNNCGKFFFLKKQMPDFFLRDFEQVHTIFLG